MNFIVPKDILAETNCDRDFSCIYGNANMMCKIEENIGEILFMKGKGLKSCRHKTLLNSSHKCECPVRKSIFRNHGH